MKGSKKVTRALGHTKADIAEHLRLDHGVTVTDWRAMHSRALAQRHSDAHAKEDAK